MDWSIEQDLRLVLLAVEGGILPSSALTEVVAAWRKKQGHLIDILAEKNLLTSSQIDEFKQLIVEASLVEANEPITGSDYSSSAFQRLADLIRGPEDPNRTQTVDDSSYKSGRRKNRTNSAVDGYGRFTNLRLLTEGGLGVIYIATDEQLNRDVALKQIRPKHADNNLLHDKFLLEAEVTGQLEHPGIVPVYAFGFDRNEQPYYAMQLIRGIDLGEVIREFHQVVSTKDDSKRGTGNRYTGVTFRGILQRFIAVCRIIEYAHQRRIIHRDLKPINIMVGEHGETLVIDWGLAKSLPDEGNKLQSSDGELSPVRIRLSESSYKTEVGSFAGTPSYAAPEQIRGQTHLFTTSLDIYSLGAVLFEILTGKSPLKEKPSSKESIDELLEAKKNPQPRSIIAAVPKPLAEICRKAMAFEISDRYSTAAALADDIERWLADEPVEAYRRLEPPIEKAGRWMRRHRSVATSLFLSLIAIAMVASAASWLINRARHAEQLAKEDAELNRDDAKNRFSVAKDAIDKTLVGTIESLGSIPGTARLRGELLEKAAEDFEKLSLNASNDPELELQRIRALVRLADLSHLQGKTDLAYEKYASALDTCQALEKLLLHRGLPLSQTATIERAKIHLRRAVAYQNERGPRQPDPRSIYSELKTAESILRPMIESKIELIYLNESWLKLLVDKAGYHEHVNELTEGATGFREAIDFIESASHEIGPLKMALKGKALEGLGVCLRKSGRYEEAHAILRESEQTRRDVLAANPDDNEARLNLAELMVKQASLDREIGDLDFALTRLQTVAAIYDDLLKKYPYDIVVEERAAMTYTNIASFQLDLGDPSNGDSAIISALEIFTRLHASNPDQPIWKEWLATAQNVSARILAELKPADEAVHADFGNCIQNIRPADGNKALIEENVGSRYLLMAIFQSQYAAYLHGIGRLDDASKLFNDAIDTFENFADVSEGTHEFSFHLARVHENHGLLKFDSGDVEMARASFDKALGLWRSILEKRSTHESRANLARFILRCPDSGLRDAKQAQELVAIAVKDLPNRRLYQMLFIESQIELDQLDAAQAGLDSMSSNAIPADAIELALRAKLAIREARIDDARTSIDAAQSWLQNNRPGDFETKRFLAALTKELPPSSAGN